MSTTLDTAPETTPKLRLREIPFEIRKVLRESVDKGARRLDHRRPRWFTTIDVKMLELSSSCNCVLGQLYGSYSHSALATVLNNLVGTDLFNAAERYGFVSHDEAVKWVERAYTNEDGSNIEWNEADAEYTHRQALVWHALDTYWKQEIITRRNATV